MAIIGKGKPLPNHTKLDYDECYAKLVLERHFQNRYSSLKILDKPDLIDEENGIGIEVTSAILQKRREAIKLWYKMPYYSAEEQDRKKERMQQLGEPYQGQIQGWTTIYPNELNEQHPLINFISAVENKVKKLNKKHYWKLKQYDLYVYSEFFIQEELLPNIIRKINEVNCGNLNFTFIYLFTQDCIYEFDCNGNYRTVEFNNVNELARQARKMVEEAENGKPL